MLRGCAQPFFGFEICDLRTFLGLKFCSDFFWVRDFGKDFSWGSQKAKPRALVFMSNNCISFFANVNYMEWTLSGILLNYYYFNLIGLFCGYVLGCWTFFGSGSSQKDFWGGLTISPHSHILVTNLYLSTPLGENFSNKFVKEHFFVFSPPSLKKNYQQNLNTETNTVQHFIWAD